MGNKTTTKKTTTAKRAAAKVAAAVDSNNETPTPATVTKPKRAKTTAAPTAAKKPAAPKRVRKKAVTMARSFTAEDIALRAYFIAEKRQRAGEYGTPESDWLEAERQLSAELAS
jgi:hypothetical protein